MALLNYTTKVPVERTMNDIERALSKAGANAVLKEYDSTGQVSAVSFRVDIGGDFVPYRLPADYAGVTRALKLDKAYRDDAHMRRVAWRIIKDWIEAQMALVQAQMAELPQVFLPYAQTNTGETVYQRIKESGMKMLAAPTPTREAE